MKIDVIGDSISIHYGPYLQAYLAGRIEYSRKEGEEEALLNLDRPQGANGGDSGMVLSFLRAKAASGGIDADLLLINCGLHDIKTDPATGERQVSIEAYAQNLRAIVDLSARMKPRLVWIRTTPCDERVHNRAGMSFHRFAADCEAYNRVADQIMAKFGVPTIDLHGFTRNLGPDLYCDHVHFHEHIREKQAAYIAGWLTAFTAKGFCGRRRRHRSQNSRLAGKAERHGLIDVDIDDDIDRPRSGPGRPGDPLPGAIPHRVAAGRRWIHHCRPLGGHVR